MGAEGVMDVNLFEFSDEDVENNAAEKRNEGNTAGENPAQGSGGESDGEENSPTAAVPFMAVPGGSGTNAPLPKPPAARPGAKVDTSQLDAELAKMNADALKNAQIPSPPDEATAHPPAPSMPPEQRISTMSTDNANEGISGEAQVFDEENAPNDGNEAEGNVQDNSAEDEENAENDSDAAAGISGEAQVFDEGNAPNDGNEAKAEVEAEIEVSAAGNIQDNSDDATASFENNTEDNPDAAAGISDEAQASNGENIQNNNNGATASFEDNAADDPDAEAGNSAPADGPDPNFAHKAVQDVRADTTPPQTHAEPADHVPPLAAQNVDYQTPPVSDLKKLPAIPSKPIQNGPIAVEKMPIVLTFETGRQKITIGELEKIREGYTFECGNPTNAPVTICANDTPIGIGELLDVDGRIGVRIIEFYNK
ncbi:MAG: FliM/FliN family flagellar motor switch protein [Puniceicoccales bacterium]|jgi:flagellar motor switch/type III secretory pathway protein FliN|nr:FliM/FliN family flagellar motor switch protein [Puniceicoccales bacterium]